MAASRFAFRELWIDEIDRGGTPGRLGAGPWLHVNVLSKYAERRVQRIYFLEMGLMRAKAIADAELALSLFAYPAQDSLGILHYRILPHQVKDGDGMVNEEHAQVRLST